MKANPVLIGVVLMLAAGRSDATYSIVASDDETGQVGGAGASCVGALDVFIIYGGAPGHGAVHAQALINASGRDEAVRLLNAGSDPDSVVDAITAASYDYQASSRQYGVVDLQQRSAGYTGADNGAYAADIQGTHTTFTYSVQGNILTGRSVLEQAQAAFEGAGCDLADRLLMALEAGAHDGGGDSRCTAQGIPANSAFLHIDRSDGSELLHLAVVDSSPDNPLVELRELYDDWRATHPCPQVTDAGVDAGADAADGGDDLSDADQAAQDDGGLARDDAGPADDGKASTSGGCGCLSTGRPPSGAVFLAVILLVFCLRGRRRPSLP